MLKQPAPTPAGRISQMLPSVKCSNCGRPVPVDELSEHLCPPTPSVPSLPRPQHSPQSASALLPPRLQRNMGGTSSPVSPLPPSMSRSPGPVPSPLGSAPVLQDPWGMRSERLEVDRYYQQQQQQPQHQQQWYTQNQNRNLSSSTPTPLDQRTRPVYDNINGNNNYNNNSNSNRYPRTAVPPQGVQRERQLDTKIGGEAGMAGVGRRGFAAATLFSPPVHSYSGPSSPVPSPPPHDNNNNFISGMDGRRANAPRFLDIDASRSATPPLSPNSNSTQSYSPGPHSPQPQVNHNDRNNVASRSPSPPQHMRAREPKLVSTTRAHPPPPPAKTPETAAPLSSTLSAARLPFFEKYKNNLPNASNGDTYSPTTTTTTATPGGGHPHTATPTHPPPPPSSGGAGRTIQFADQRRQPEPGRRARAPPPVDPIGVADDYDYDHHHHRRKKEGDGSAPSPKSDSDVGLAYAESEYSDVEDVASSPPPPPPLKSHAKESGKKAPPPPLDLPPFPSDQVHQVPVRNGILKKAVDDASRSAVDTRPWSKRSDSYSSSHYSKSTGSGLDRRLEMLEDENENAKSGASFMPLAKSKSTSSAMAATAVVSGGGGGGKNHGLGEGIIKAQRSNTVSSPENKSAKLPGRSRDGGWGEDGKGVERKKKVCARCEIVITDGRWIQMDGGRVLCEKCWKNMYLPKCRRCNLPIEKQAVSSSDGQLKGKYHRECFNCHTCHKPFPDKSFYVFDGKPLCAYHYHEANDSLCAAGTCGQPIEGPCAVSHAGDRYHPEHFLCEHLGPPRCRERLKEYWEVDGRMLCERHANAARNEHDDDDDDDREPSRTWAPSARATKRVTRFIDLAGNNGLR